MDNNSSIRVKNVVKVYNLYDNSKQRLKEIISISHKCYHKKFYALKNINFEVEKGETFGIIGTNGSGKSTLLKLITGVSTQTEGEITVNGKISALLELGAGFNRNYTGIENIYLNGTMMGYSMEEMEKKVPSIVEFADIGDFINQPVKNYSSGMFARLAFAVAISIEPEILIVDEALSVGDVFFQNKCYKKFEELRSKGITVIFVSHDIGTVKQLCSRVLWIEKGEQKMVGDSTEVCNEYANSILAKRAKEYKKQKDKLEVHGESTVDGIENSELKNLPAISYTNESILNPDVQIISCFISNYDGERVSSCEAGKMYSLSIYFRTKIDIDECVVGFVIETKKGIWVINCNSLSTGPKKGITVKKNTINKAEFLFEMPNIVNGDYVIGVAISEGNLMDFKVLTWLYNVLYLQITNVPENDALLKLESDIRVYSGEE